MKFYLFLSVLLFSIMLSSCETSLDAEKVSALLKKDMGKYIAKQENPVNINLYADLSNSMKDHLNLKINEQNNTYEKLIKQLYSSKHEANFNLFGFGDDLKTLGKNDEVVRSLLNIETYDESSSRINLAFDQIMKDSSNTLSIVLSDARYEDTDGDMSKFSFMVGNYFKEYVGSNKLFAVIANKYWCYFPNSNKNRLTPLYLFLIADYKHYNFIVENLISAGDDSFILSPYPENKIKYQSNNANLVQNDQLFAENEVDDYGTPVTMKISFLRNTLNKAYRKMLINDDYSSSIYESSLLINDDNYSLQNGWTRLSANDFKLSMNSKFNKDSSSYIFDLLSENVIKKTTNYKVLKFELLANIPKWINDKYSTNDTFDIEKTYKFSEFFLSLQNHLNSAPVPSQVYYIIIK